MSEPTDNELIANALRIRANIIETGDPILSAADVANGHPLRKAPAHRSAEQYALADRIRKLAERYER